MDTASGGHEAAREDNMPSNCDSRSAPRLSVCVTPPAEDDEAAAAAVDEEEKD